ncbi:MAG TPA: His/Gly/Thr/Pro-type tRNA ligase C-terminal domain-containing protein, partial [Alphaproteobacteria bacterium]|nr:His/Gly/Thr/Pro-type tRNA ligase C-terminal domain-containing protein [Alphaproteobacteria bacterium]
NEVVQRLLNFVSLKSLKDLNSPAANETKRLIETLEKLGYGEWIEFSPLVLRGFDYYDGIVFEVFDNNPLNTRSMFGGGRYNGLAGIFGQEPFPAVGSAPGDETTRLFLEGWNILPKIKSTPTQVLVTIFSPELADKSLEISQNLRSSGINVELYPETEIKLDKQLKYADKKQIPYVVIIGPEEIENKVVVLKNLETKEQKKVTMNELCQLLA